MDRLGWWEWGVVVSLVGVLLIMIMPSLWYARAEARDGIRRAELRSFKTLLEEKNNELGYYPMDVVVDPHEYRVLEHKGAAAVSWRLRAELENSRASEAGFDEEFNVYYRVFESGGQTFYEICGGEDRCGVEVVD